MIQFIETVNTFIYGGTMQDIAKGYIFTLYPEHDAAIQEYADAEWRGNRSEALRRIIEQFKQHYNGHTALPTPETTEQATT